jgi:NAD(P)-dependent dehydrogenase (short-subunit alcohol dehydrogenase family)
LSLNLSVKNKAGKAIEIVATRVKKRATGTSKMEETKEYILITGASSGIGRSIAIKLAETNNIILVARDIERLEATKRLCSSNFDCQIFQSELNNLNSIEETFSKAILDNKWKIRHFIHSAGYVRLLPIRSTSLETIQTTFSTNFVSASLITKVLINKKVNGSALKSIVFISSNISNFGAKAFSIYAASKGALDSLMRCLAVELAPKVRVNSVLPGPIRTEMTKNILESRETTTQIAEDYPLGLGEPDDISNMVEYLISNKAKWVTGQQFTVDGGGTINLGS